ncbi:MAG: ArsA-related P-loop ATPase [Pseudomonadota bacterium]
MTILASLVAEKRVVVVCGAGGVGKTTVAAALALAGARQGRRVLVLTIDPSKRLAETLGVSRNLAEPLELDASTQSRAGIKAPGSLSAWLINPGAVAQRVVGSLPQDVSIVTSLLQNRVFRNISQMVAGMQEYTAMESLHQLLGSGKWDMIVLDTPPSRNALNFLEAPERLMRFLDGRILKAFLVQKGGLFRSATSKLVWKVLGVVFGDEFFKELRGFIGGFGPLMDALSGNAQDMKRRLQGPDVAFLLVTSPAPQALEDAFDFHQHIRQMGLPFGGFILNRTRSETGLRFPSLSILSRDPTEDQASALRKLISLAAEEQLQSEADLRILEELQQMSGQETGTMAVPELPGGVSNMEELARLVAWLVP